MRKNWKDIKKYSGLIFKKNIKERIQPLKEIILTFEKYEYERYNKICEYIYNKINKATSKQIENYFNFTIENTTKYLSYLQRIGRIKRLHNYNLSWMLNK